MAFSNPDLLTGLTAFWNLNETSGTRADSTGTYDLAENGGAVPSGSFNPEFNPTQNCGRVATYSGSDGCLERTNATDFHVGNTNFTVSAWLTFGALLSGNRCYVGKYFVETSGLNWSLQYANGFLVFAFGTDTAPNETHRIATTFTYTPIDLAEHNQIEKPFAVDTWYHVVCQHVAGSGIRMCLNNGTMSPLKWTFRGGAGFLVSSTSRFAIGSRDSSTGTLASRVIGRISNVGIWPRLLSDSEVGWLYNGGYGLDYPFTYG